MPTVLACYTYGSIDKDIEDYGSVFGTCISICLVDGQMLDSVWDSYSEPTKAAIAISTEIIHGRDSQPWKWLLHWPRRSRHCHNPNPFNYHTKGRRVRSWSYSLSDIFTAALLYRKSNSTKQSLPPMKRISPNVISDRTLLDAMLSQNKHCIVFTRRDFRLQNIIVENGKATSIIDWELSGWYPQTLGFCQVSIRLEVAERLV